MLDQPTGLIRRATVFEIVAARNAALASYGEAHDSLVAADSVFEQARTHMRGCGGGVHNSYNDHLRRDGAEKVDLFIKVPDRAAFLAKAKRVVDAGAWAHVVQLCDLERLMDKKAKDELREQLTNNPPEVTEDNILATVENFMLEADTIFKRGIAVAFSKLDRRFKSHDGWKIGARVILTHCFTCDGYWNYHGNERDTLVDIERTFQVLEGVKPADYGGIVGAVEAARKGGWGARQTEVDSEYFKVRIFKNGNAHLWFKRDDLVDRVNQLLGEYYGAPIPQERGAEDRKADPFAKPKTTPAKDFGFFPTPAAAAELVKQLTPLNRWQSRDQFERPPFRVLEPSAGTGNLARLFAEAGAVVDCIEMQSGLADALQSSGRYRNVRCADFLKVAPSPIYDRVVMNPPFDRERDIDHVIHAMKFLRPEGFLIAIMSAGTEFRETKKSVAFRAKMESLNAQWRDLPAGSFSEVGTYCNTVIVRFYADGRTFYG